MKEKKILSLFLAIITLLSLCSCSLSKESEGEEKEKTEAPEQVIYTQEPGSVTKSETVYINLDNSGTVENISVTDWLHTDKGEVRVKDESDLTGIVNVKDDTEPVKTGDTSLEWNMSGTDVYYSGNTQKAPPVSISLKYYLDGEEMSAEEIKGKSGKIRIEAEMANNEYREEEIDGKKEKIYLPMLVVGGCILPEGQFNGIKVENGRSIGDGTKEIVAFFGLPGLNETLGLDELGLTDGTGLDLGSTAAVEAQTENFELSNMYFAAIPLGCLNLNLENTAAEGGLKAIAGVVDSLQKALSALDTKELINAFSSGGETVGSLVSLINSGVEIYNDNKALLSVLSKYTEDKYKEQLESFLEFLTDESTIRAIKVLNNSDVISFFKKLSGFEKNYPMLSSLLEDLQQPQVLSALEKLPDTLEKLAGIAKTVNENSALVDSIMSLFNSDGLEQINSLLSVFDGIDFEKLSDRLSSVSSAGIGEKCERWISFGKEYKIFTLAGENTTSSVLFIYKTPSIGE